METIGDAYMVVSGVPDVTVNHAYNMADMALDMTLTSQQVLSPATGKPIQVLHKNGQWFLIKLVP